MPYGKIIDQTGMAQSTMLYKHPGPYKIHKSYFDYTIVDKAADDYDEALKDGWYPSTTEALKHSTAKEESKLTQKDFLKAQADVLTAKQESEKALADSIKAEEENEKLKAEIVELKKAAEKVEEPSPAEIVEAAKKRTGGGKGK